MFSKATANFVRQIDTDGSLIHVSRVNDSRKLVPMGLVVKRNRFWFWQRPKYQPTDFTLSDLLQGDKVLSPGVSEADFVSYKGTFGDQVSGKVDTEAGSVSISVEGRGSSKLQSLFGKLKIQELEVKKLLQDSRNRYMDMQHVLVQQLEKREEVLAVVKQRIFTTSSCSVTQTKKEQCTFQGVLGLVGMLGSSVKVCVKDSNNMEADSDVSLEIPPGTVIAYSVLELEIKKDGHYAIWLQPGTGGGIEQDSAELSWPSNDSLNEVDGHCNGSKVPEKAPLRTLQNGSQQMDLSPLAELPPSTQCDLFEGLQEALRDRIVLSYLQSVLQDVCCGETTDTAKCEDLSENQRKLVSSILDPLGVENSRCAAPALLNAAHLLLSALEELPDETLSLLSESRADFLEAFNTLMRGLQESSEPLSIQCLPILLQDHEALQLAELLLSSANLTLSRDTDRLWMETGRRAELHLVVLSLSVHGLSLLCNGLK